MRSNWQEFDQSMQDADALPLDQQESRTSYGPLSNFDFGPEDNDLGTVFIIHNVDDTIAIKVRSPGDQVFSEVEMSIDDWTKLRAVGVPL